MEIEAKVVLETRGDFDRAVEVFKGEGYTSDTLENYFFDGPNEELAGQGVMFRLRIKSTSAEINIKSHTEIEQGAACRFSETVKLSVEDAREAISKPTLLLPLVPSVQASVASLKYLGGFKTERMTGKAIFASGAVTVKLDEVMYQFGTHYELEIDCGSLPVTDIYEEVMKCLAGNGIKGRMGTRNKFQTFIAGCRASLMAPSSMSM
eukprot:TRINITY_DN175_c24_g1_i1.p1 TRINITY_DN175_c24_g1~~TRINITY_DN175_c24_g1_i1.p1  ORF type:complete len:221 (+),score=67.43 TRINITY_DN175_c24_g1_i1:45-665(+)